MTSRSAITLALVGLTAGSASAAVTYVSADRTVTATSAGTPQTFNSAALGEYNRTASVTRNDPNPPGTQTASASASITSNLLPDRITYALSASASDGVSASSGFGAGSASTSMSVRFSIDVPTPFALVGTFPSPIGNSAGASERLTLVGASGDVFSQSFNTIIGGAPFQNLSGMLAPGTYDFTASVGAATLPSGSGTSFSNSSFSRQLVIPAPVSAGLLALGGLTLTRRRRP
ncbi:MAG: hypothetical protein K2W85_13670 [Phycisphaerales bacterium]|nr:hypothetical protein [Phycisphaerales bacterium]